MVDSSALLRVSGLGKEFHRRGVRGSVTALDAFDVTIEEGQSIAIIGESGSGKTTAARIIAGLESATRGEVRIDGRLMEGRGSSRRIRRWRSSRVQMVFQDPYQSLDRRQTIYECLDEALRLHGERSKQLRSRRIESLLTQVGLEARHAASLPRNLSGGQRQRVAIARALAARPRLLVLDEAVSALDVSVQAQVLNLLQKIRSEEGIALLFISHDLSVVARISTEIIVMHRGRTVERGLTEEILRNPADPYTRALLASIPRPGWIPRRRNGRTTVAAPVLPR